MGQTGIYKKAFGSTGIDMNTNSPNWKPPSYDIPAPRVPKPEDIDSRVIQGLEQKLPEIKKELGLKNLDIKRVGSGDSLSKDFRDWDRDSTGLFSNYEGRNAGQKWLGMKVPHGLQWLAAAGNRTGNTAASLIGNIGNSIYSTGARGYDAFAQDNPTIFVYPDGTFELYDTQQHAQEAIGHALLTGANAVSFGAGGKIIGAAGKGVAAGAGKMAPGIFSRLTPEAIKRLGLNTLHKVPGGAAVANIARKPAVQTTAALVGGYGGGGHTLSNAAERKDITSAAMAKPFNTSYLQDYVDSNNLSQAGGGSGSDSKGMSTGSKVLLGAGGLAGLYALANSGSSGNVRIPSREELEERKRRRRRRI